MIELLLIIPLFRNSNRFSFHGQGGITARPTQQEQLALRESHVKPTSSQLAVVSSARVNKSQFVSVNHGRPQKLVETTARNNVAKTQQTQSCNKSAKP